MIQIFPTHIQVHNCPEFISDARQFIDAVGYSEDVPDIIYEVQDVDACKQCADFIVNTYSAFTDVVLDRCMEFAKNIYHMHASDRVKIKYAWPMVYSLGTNFFPHQHMSDNIKMSAIYYTDIGTGSSPLRFYDPRYFTGDCTQKNLTYDFHPTEGDLLIYPSNLVHGVPNNNSTNRRCVVFDVSIVRN